MKHDPQSEYACSALMGEWAKRMDLDAVIWTALPAKFNKQGEIPSIENVINYLSELLYKEQKKAQKALEYIQKTPIQISTNYRKKLKRCLVGLQEIF